MGRSAGEPGAKPPSGVSKSRSRPGAPARAPAAARAAEPDQPVVGEPAQHRKVSRHRDGELEHVPAHPQPALRRHDGIVAALADPALTRLVPPAAGGDRLGTSSVSGMSRRPRPAPMTMPLMAGGATRRGPPAGARPRRRGGPSRGGARPSAPASMETVPSPAPAPNPGPAAR